MFFRCPSIQALCNEAGIYLNFGTPKNNDFSIWNKWKIYYFWVSQYLSTLGYDISCMGSESIGGRGWEQGQLYQAGALLFGNIAKPDRHDV